MVIVGVSLVRVGVNGEELKSDSLVPSSTYWVIPSVWYTFLVTSHCIIMIFFYLMSGFELELDELFIFTIFFFISNRKVKECLLHIWLFSVTKIIVVPLSLDYTRFQLLWLIRVLQMNSANLICTVLSIMTAFRACFFAFIERESLIYEPPSYLRS
ncbi:unnamed protein product [Rodentolepis nana]|uniref:XK-related protein n=1 Tax=Rodentolepis nana TaxID=102285 RepID=A0A0R3T847_RODNA|nr:unnamed protein product [Rodentolepis nana]